MLMVLDESAGPWNPEATPVSVSEATVTYISTIEEADATGPLAELYAGLLDPEFGRVDAILKVHALHPAGLKAHLELYRTVMRPTPGLRKAERELIALVVSQANECHY